MSYVAPTLVDVPPGTTPPPGAVPLDTAVLQPALNELARLSAAGGGGGGISVVDNGDGTVTLTATGSSTIVDNGDGTVTITP